MNETLQTCLAAIASAKSVGASSAVLCITDTDIVPSVFNDLEEMGYAFQLENNRFTIWNLYPFSEPKNVRTGQGGKTLKIGKEQLENYPVDLPRKTQLSPTERANILYLFREGVSMRRLAKKYKRSKEGIRKIIRKGI